MIQSLDVISINLWQMLVSLVNLVILFLLVKKFLYKPVQKMLAKRQGTIDGEYDAAKQAKEQALADQAAYEEKLKNAKQEADEVIKSAVDIANERQQEIIADARDKAQGIIRQAQSDAELEMKKAESTIKREIVDVSTLLTEKMLEREINADDHKGLIDSFIEEMGDDNDANV
ncbi:MAG: F0F1 ATP synthase subunit B [Clostridia bacterium]|nr:F0F1 ATP synthase subunit B [Clostridia bacterium]